MARHPWLDPAPFFLGNGPTGILLIHGFTGAPPEMRPLGEFLADHGYTASCPLLPGHGVQPSALNQVRWQEWADAVQAAYRDLRGRSQQVFVGGLSLGGLLALHLAAHEPSVQGLLLFAPGLRLLDRRLPLTTVAKYILPLRPKNELADSDLADPEAFDRLWSYEVYPLAGASQLWRLQRTVRKELSRVQQPVLIIQGRRDRSIHPDTPQTILVGVRSKDTRLIWLENSGHALTVDAERQQVFEVSLAWIQERERRPANQDALRPSE